MEGWDQPQAFAGEPVQVMMATADPHLRMVVAQELAADRRTELVAQPGSVAEARRRMAEAHFDVLLIDMRLGRTHVLELIGLRCALQRRAEVVVICAADDEDAAVEAFHAGASGCLVGKAGFGSFVQAAVEVASGRAALTPSLARRLLRRHDGPAAAPPIGGAGAVTAANRLTSRETQVLSMVARGLRTHEIGQQLTISADTVNAHIKSIYRKLQVRSRAQAVRIAMQVGLL